MITIIIITIRLFYLLHTFFGFAVNVFDRNFFSFYEYCYSILDVLPELISITLSVHYRFFIGLIH